MGFEGYRSGIIQLGQPHTFRDQKGNTVEPTCMGAYLSSLCFAHCCSLIACLKEGLFLDFVLLSHHYIHFIILLWRKLL